MAKKESIAKNRKKLPFAVFRKGALCALLGAGVLAGGVLAGCDETGVVSGLTDASLYYGTENPNPTDNPGKVGDFYLETDDGDVWQLTEDGWEVVSNIKGPQGNPGTSPVVTISDDGFWVINGIKTQNKAVGVEGAQGYYVTDVKEVVDDVWGISSHFEFVLNDDAKTTISTPSVVRLMQNHYYGATTGAEILELIELGAENIQIENDIELTSALAIDHNLSIDLNNHKLTYVDGTQIVIDNGIEVEFKDGEMHFEAKTATTSSLKVQGGASLILDRVEYVSAGTNVMVIENATSVKVVDSHLTGAVYCVGTNALTEQNFGVEIEIDDCEFDTTGYEWLGDTWYDTTPILINIPCNATIKDSKITGHRQAVVVRGGNVVIEDCTLISTGKDLVKGLGLEYNASAWGSGNAVAMATLVAGNDGRGIYANYATNLTITNTEIKTKKASVPAIFAIGNDGENLGVNLVIDTDLEQNIPTTIIANDNVKLSFEVDSARDLFNVAKEVYEDRNIVIMGDKSNFAPSIVLTQDINENVVLSFDEYGKYGFMAQMFNNFIVNTDEFDYNVNFYTEVGNSMEVAVLMEAVAGIPDNYPPFIILKNNIDMADIFEMMGYTTMSSYEADMIALLNKFVVRSDDYGSMSDMYMIYCSLPTEVHGVEELTQIVAQVVLNQTMLSKISLETEVEFNQVVESLIEVMMNMPQPMAEGQEMGETQTPTYYMMPTIDLYLAITELLTDETKSNLVWEEGNEIVSVASYNALKYAVNETEAEEIKLYSAVDCDTAVVINREVIIDLNYNALSVYNDPNGDGVFRVVAGGKLTINGEGVVDGVGNNNWNMVLCADGGEIVVNGGTYTNERTMGTDDHYDLIYAKNGGKVTINGGTFMCVTPRWTLNLKDNDGSTIIVNGGTFKNYDPSFSQTENPPANFVNPQCAVSILGDGMDADVWYTIVPGLGQEINNPYNGGYVYLENDMTIANQSAEAKTIINNDVIVDFADSTINLNIPNANSATENWCAVNVNGGNVVFEGNNGGVVTSANAELYAVTIRNGANLTINGGNYIGGTTAINLVQGTLMINGGFFASRIDGDDASNGRWTINCYDANYKNGTAQVIITGGTFVNFNPADNLCEGEGTNYLAEGYKVVEEVQENGDIWYIVVAE